MKIMELLQTKGAAVAYHDPFVPRLGKMREYNFDMESVPLTSATIQSYDCDLIVTDHSVIDYEQIVRASPLIVDTRNATRGVTPGRGKIVRC